jgi:hypothetical protein
MIPISQFEKHTVDQKCKPNPNDDPICHLCETNIADLKCANHDEGWKKHILQDKCKRNPRLT